MTCHKNSVVLQKITNLVINKFRMQPLQNGNFYIRKGTKHDRQLDESLSQSECYMSVLQVIQLMISGDGTNET